MTSRNIPSLFHLDPFRKKFHLEISVAMVTTLCISCHLGIGFKFEANWILRYDLTNLYTFYIGPYERFALEAPPDPYEPI